MGSSLTTSVIPASETKLKAIRRNQFGGSDCTELEDVRIILKEKI